MFARIAQLTAYWLGTPRAFILACVGTIIWAVCGPYFHYSDTWQLVINTGTTVLTFLAVFLIQNTQNRDSAALHLKIDELLRVNQDARNALIGLESKPESMAAVLKEKSIDKS